MSLSTAVAGAAAAGAAAAKAVVAILLAGVTSVAMHSLHLTLSILSPI